MKALLNWMSWRWSPLPGKMDLSHLQIRYSPQNADQIILEKYELNENFNKLTIVKDCVGVPVSELTQ